MLERRPLLQIPELLYLFASRNATLVAEPTQLIQLHVHQLLRIAFVSFYDKVYDPESTSSDQIDLCIFQLFDPGSAIMPVSFMHQ